MKANEICPRPAKDEVLVSAFCERLSGPGLSWDWLGVPMGMRTDSVRKATQALGISDPDRIAKTLIYRARLLEHGDWTYGCVFVPGTCRLEIGALCRTLDALEVELAPRDEVKRVTGFEPGAMPPLVTPAVVDERLMRRNEACGELYFSGLTEHGLYRVTFDAQGYPADGRSGNQFIFDSLLEKYGVLAIE